MRRLPFGEVEMTTELIVLGVLFILMCIMDYLEFKDEIKDMKQDDEEEE